MSAATNTFRIRARGPFSLTAAAAFTAAFPAGQAAGDARLDLAFPAEVAWTSVAVRVTEDGTSLLAEVVTNPGALPLGQIRSQVERILSLDVDGTDFPAIAERDPAVRDLQARYPTGSPPSASSPD